MVKKVLITFVKATGRGFLEHLIERYHTLGPALIFVPDRNIRLAAGQEPLWSVNALKTAVILTAQHVPNALREASFNLLGCP